MHHIVLFCLIAVAAGIPASRDILMKADLLRAQKPQVICIGQGEKFLEPYEYLSHTTPYPDFYRWPDGIVPYDFDSDLRTNASDAYLRSMVRVAMKEIERVTNNCVKFVSRKKSRDADWVRIIRGVGCNSCVGKQHMSIYGKQIYGTDDSPQYLSLGFGCENHQTIMHELLHALGMTHEHQRPDRDDYVIVSEECLGENDPRQNYGILSPKQITCYTPFDMKSIMLYGSNAMYKKNCMTDLEGNKLTEVYNKKGLSASDIKRVKILYGCDGEKDTMSKKLCQQMPE